MPGREAVSTLHLPKNDIVSFFKFLQKTVYWQRNLQHLNKSISFATCFFQITSPIVIHNCAGIFLSSQETLFCRNLKNDRIMLRLPRVGHLWPLLIKSCRV
jgi:hypothetical protein